MKFIGILVMASAAVSACQGAPTVSAPPSEYPADWSFTLDPEATGVDCRDVDLEIEPNAVLVRQCGVRFIPVLAAIDAQANCLVRGDFNSAGEPKLIASACATGWDRSTKPLDLSGAEANELIEHWFRNAAETAFAGHRFRFTGQKAENGRSNVVLPIIFTLSDTTYTLGEPDVDSDRDLVGDWPE